MTSTTHRITLELESPEREPLVLFVPIKLQPREAHRAYVDQRGIQRTRKAEKTREYQDRIKQRVSIEMAGLKRKPLSGMVLVWITLVFAAPQSLPAADKKRVAGGELIPCVGRSDVDNHIKSILDSIKKICFGDDRHVVLLVAGKFIGQREGFQLFALPFTAIDYRHKLSE